MSVHKSIKRPTVPELMVYKNDKKIVALTAYTAPFARLLDGALDMILVGDSTAMVGYAMDDTLSITVEQMTAHGKAVVRSTQQACVVIDMPFGSFQESPEQAFREDRKSTRLNSSHVAISYAVFCLKKKNSNIAS